jgi:DNA-3-methyladenine glycosylase II
MSLAIALTEESITAAVTSLCGREPRFLRVVRQHGVPSLRAMPEGLESLLQIVTEQFLSLQAAHAIWCRVRDCLVPVSGAGILACPQQELMRLGLSAAKAKSFHGIARTVVAQPDFFTALPQQDDAAVRKALVALPGVGPWTAEIYLLAALARSDAWPVGDLALRQAAADLFELPGVPNDKAMDVLGRPFSPWRAVVARLLWSHYRGLKGLQQAP